MKIVAVTACPTGIAHTYMAAEALQIAANELDINMKVETRGSVGAENELTETDIEWADAVIIAADTNVPLERFAGKKLIKVSVKCDKNCSSLRQ
jgi:PTS system fructose-specific IIC component